LQQQNRRSSGSTISTLSDCDKADVSQTLIQNAVLEYSLKYDKYESRMSIRIFQIRRLAFDEHTDHMSPYVRIRLYRAPKQLFTFRGHLGTDYVINNLDVELQTKMQKSNEILVYNETFVVAVSENEVRSYTLRFQLCDLDKFSRHVVFGETSLSMRDTKIADFTETHFSEPLMLPKEVSTSEQTVVVRHQLSSGVSCHQVSVVALFRVQRMRNCWFNTISVISDNW
jgi:hypothetical protein